MKALTERLAEIQRTLNAPKNQHNKFGGYNYRSCEDILQAVKPLLNGLVITVNDDITVAGDRVYVKATATITDGEHSISTTAFAREAAMKKGMDDSQITGSTSSYARKYALNGLLLIDDNKDADSRDNREAHKEPQTKPFNIDGAVKAIRSANDSDTVNKYVQAAKNKGATQLQMQSIQNEAMQRLEQLGEPA
ncbi:ERF superfamily protein [Modicisalibacter xianhensis]|uniref:ERF superfamily protein n=1 Tax=Modicisalibacter xianhensis TaxID=442341 RepID=A0A4R8FYS0_9GAMM|nr:ERF family protein [Halomonas xianhensis]TDX30800.1 ERF superfamily protein [Halomonas xianhensis]